MDAVRADGLLGSPWVNTNRSISRVSMVVNVLGPLLTANCPSHQNWTSKYTELPRVLS